jgi:Tfp pilus assembly protein PilV
MIYQLLKLRKIDSRKDTGFTTLEILISLVIALLFVAVSMQSLVYAMAMKVQAQEKQRANELIQEDTCNPTNYAGGYAKALWTASIPANTQTKTIIKTGGRQLALRRFEMSSTANNSTAPHRTLKVGYQIWNWDGTNFLDKNGGTLGAGDEPIAETYVEVIPDVALECP